jgi:hypothetical protein
MEGKRLVWSRVLIASSAPAIEKIAQMESKNTECKKKIINKRRANRIRIIIKCIPKVAKRTFSRVKLMFFFSFFRSGAKRDGARFY